MEDPNLPKAPSILSANVPGAEGANPAYQSVNLAGINGI